MKKHLELELMYDGVDIFVIFDGVRIAKRGRPESPQAGTWVSLEPGWEVRGIKQLEITYDGVAVH